MGCTAVDSPRVNPDVLNDKHIQRTKILIMEKGSRKTHVLAGRRVRKESLALVYLAGIMLPFLDFMLSQER